MTTGKTRTFHFMAILAAATLLLSCGDDEGTQPNPTTGTIQGTIKDAETGEPLGNVSITTAPPSQSAVTGGDGNYALDNLIPTQYTVNTEKIGYVNKSVIVQVIAGEVTMANILMEKATIGGSDSISVLDFDGVDDHIIVPHSPDLDLSDGSFTVEAMVNAKAFNTSTIRKWNWVVNHGTSNDNQDFLLGFEQGIPVFSVRSTATVLKAIETAIPGQWYHIAGVLDVENSKVFIYINGALKGEKSLTGNGVATLGNLFIGARERLGTGEAAEHFSGVIREVRLWNHARSEDQIRQTMTTVLSGSESGLIAGWRLDEGMGSILFDAANHGHNGNAIGSPTWWRIDNPWN